MIAEGRVAEGSAATKTRILKIAAEPFYRNGFIAEEFSDLYLRGLLVSNEVEQVSLERQGASG